MKPTWSHLLPVLLLIAAVTLETAASKDVERESNRGRYGIFRNHRRSVANNVDDLPSGRILTPDFLNRIKGQPSGNSCPPHTETYTEPTETITLVQPTASSYSPTSTVYVNSSSRALAPIADDYDEDDESDYEFDRNAYNRDDGDVDDGDYEDDIYLVSVKNGQQVLPMRQFDSNNDLSVSLDNDFNDNSFPGASRQSQSNNLRRRRMRRRAAARRRRQRRRRQQMRRRRLQRLRRNRRRRVVRRGPNVRRNRNRGRRTVIPGVNRIINI